MNGSTVTATDGMNGQLRISVETDFARSFFEFVRSKDGNPNWPQKISRPVGDHTFTADGTMEEFQGWKAEWLLMVEALNQ